MMTVTPRNICHIIHQPTKFSRRSGMLPLSEAVGAATEGYSIRWKQWRQRSWLAGYLGRRFGNWYYGSIYNDVFPIWDETQLLQRVRKHDPEIIHFIWSEFASPSLRGWKKRRGSILLGTYHSSVHRLPAVCATRRTLRRYDGLVLMSGSQRLFFEERGYDPKRLRVIHHGVDLEYFAPESVVQNPASNPLRLLLVGSTERDHAFAAAVLREINSTHIHLYVRTYSEQANIYNGLSNVTTLPRLSDEELRQQYQQADLLFMPMIHCTANNAILEAMACGTPVIVNAVGGVPEYVDRECNFVMKGKIVESWCDQLKRLERNRQDLYDRRGRVREWAESFSWDRAGGELMTFYEDIFNTSK